MRKILLLLILIVNIGYYNPLAAQELEKKVSLNVVDLSLEEILTDLNERYSISFYYLNNELPEKRYSIQFEEKSLSEVLTVLLKDTNLEFVEREGQVILKRKPFKNEDLPQKKTESSKSHNPVASAPMDTVYINEIGISDTAFKKEEMLSVAVDSTITNDTINISDAQPHQGEEFILKESKVKPYYFGIIYPFSTNGVEAAEYINNFSLHLFGGLSKGVNGFEASGLGNLTLGDVEGVQFAGWANIVEEDVYGGQFAGIVNMAGAQFEGIQIAGTANVVLGDYKGVQASGIVNVVGSNVDGFQIAGVVNVAEGNVSKGQVSGFVNIAKKITGPQIAGFGNVQEGNGSGPQVSGFFNVAEKLNGPQIAGFINVAKEVKGIQAAGFINVAKKVKGMQLGVINIADSLDGIPIGILSFVKNGYFDLELFYSDDFHGNAVIKIGAQKFHNLFGFSYEADYKNRWAYGYGIGSQWGKRTLRLNTDLMAYHVIEQKYPDGAFNDFGLNLLSKLRLLASVHFGNFGIFAGPVYNVMLSKHIDPDTGTIGSDIGSHAFFDETYNGITNLKMWLGFNVGLRF